MTAVLEIHETLPDDAKMRRPIQADAVRQDNCVHDSSQSDVRQDADGSGVSAPRIIHVGNIYCYPNPTHGGRGGDIFIPWGGLCPTLALNQCGHVPYILLTQ